MTELDAALEAFVTAIGAAIGRRLPMKGEARSVADRIFRALAFADAAEVAPSTARLPVCAHLETAYSLATAAKPGAAASIVPFRAIEPHLRWRRRASQDDPGFAEAYADADLIGPEGLIRRPDVRIGVSLLAPGMVYPDHSHPPAELYYVLSQGWWRQGDGEWFAPRPGGVVYNPPGILHAMRAAQTPLFAFRCLWLPGAA